MKELRINDQNILRIQEKVITLLKLGFKIKGNYSRQNNIIRSWSRNKKVIFSIVATSGREFGHDSDILEIKSFGLNRDSFLAIMLMHNNIFETRLESKPESEDKDIQEFLETFLNSEADLNLIKEKIAAEGHNLNDITYPFSDRL